MKVDFNNLRLQTAYALDNVIKTLNAGILPEINNVLIGDDTNEKWYSGNVLINTDDLEKHIDHLRSCVYSLICCYEENNPEYKMLADELESNGGLAHFNDTQND